MKNLKNFNLIQIIKEAIKNFKFNIKMHNEYEIYLRTVNNRYSKNKFYTSNIKCDDMEKFIFSFNCTDGNKGKYIGTTKEIRKQLDNHIFDFSVYYDINENGYCNFSKENEYRNMSIALSILKYGICYEWKEKFLETGSHYVIDNALHIEIKKLEDENIDNNTK